MSACVCVRASTGASRFHVVSLQDGLDGQVAHARVFGKVALGPELVLQHLGEVAHVLPRRGLPDKEREVSVMSSGEETKLS